MPSLRSVRRPIAWLLLFGCLLVCWFALVGKFSWAELIVGVPCAVIATVAWYIAWNKTLPALRGNGRGLAQAWRLVGYAFSGTFEIFAVLFRQLFGGKPADSLLRAAPYEGATDEPEQRLRQALAIAYTSITPNFIVLGIDAARSLLVFHQIQKSGVLKMTRKLGARA